ncbi:Clp protease N-terminal domain-containing protein [Streptomyces albireticuli]|uniref:Peptidase n=1 Tax=Streptomyces albireticuli TaxID=1940 RepID=A0A2A2D273_9ACTN|nr:Clp protease N-terminal domain-containing protein [Streptomyces albireticuli]MCD9145328.1 peptidase [Streptomyces albireticuli]MCD9166007.1 peptidase [Streptomyces albireticuli]MCD9196282.1 peptidase [Streptomyces albireticuli]PAU45634.1 peptidase [Streptomyces albireticuli]
MQSRTRDIGPAGTACEDRLSVELASVVAGARRRAVRDGDRQVDTAHLLHTLLEADPETRRVLDGGTGRVVRLLGYLVQRAIGYGLRWSGTAEDSGALPVLADSRAPGWSPPAAAALERAYARARARGAGRVAGVDLLAALARDRDCRAAEVLRRAGIDPGALATGFDGAHDHGSGSGGGGHGRAETARRTAMSERDDGPVIG